MDWSAHYAALIEASPEAVTHVDQAGNRTPIAQARCVENEPEIRTDRNGQEEEVVRTQVIVLTSALARAIPGEKIERSGETLTIRNVIPRRGCALELDCTKAGAREQTRGNYLARG